MDVVKEKIDLDNKFETDIEFLKLRKEISKSFNEYKNMMKYLSADAPIETLCLPIAIENILVGQGCLRIYDMIDMDLAKVKGLGPTRLRQLTTRLDQFFSMF